MPTPNQQNQDLRDELRAIGIALTSNGTTIQQRLEEIDRRLQAQNAAMSELRRELMALFVPRSEYEPRHTVLVEKIDKIEKQIDSGRPLIEEFITVKAHVAQNSLDVEELQKHNSALGSRLMGLAALGISAAGMLISLLQHVQIR